MSTATEMAASLGLHRVEARPTGQRTPHSHQDRNAYHSIKEIVWKGLVMELTFALTLLSEGLIASNSI